MPTIIEGTRILLPIFTPKVASYQLQKQLLNLLFVIHEKHSFPYRPSFLITLLSLEE